MNEIAPGIYHWTAHHPPISASVSSYYIEPAAVVLDPKTPEGGWDDLPGRPQQVLLTSGHHSRDAQDCAQAFGIPIRASREAAEHLDGQLAVETFGDGDEPAPGITAIHIGKLSRDEGAFHIAVDAGAIAFADGLNRYGGALGFFPDELLGEHPDRVKEGLKQSFAGLLQRDFAHLLFAHGEPLTGGGKSALRDFIERPAGHEDHGQSV
ncbi:MAG TPA: hypothetical protein VFN87_18455 [Solirubrobacteraceae bacterium]|nr:hypothetical protein [Solirubrobacteraceae bacterium]